MTGTIVAVKMIRTDSGSFDEKALRREMDIYERIKQISNRHLLVVKDIRREGGQYALVTEFAEGGSLWDLMRENPPEKTPGESSEERHVALDEPTSKEIALAIVDGLSALHENDIVHRDIKPQNILRCDDTWKIADFGISKLTNKPVTGYTFQGAHPAPWRRASRSTVHLPIPPLTSTRLAGF